MMVVGDKINNLSLCSLIRLNKITEYLSFHGGETQRLSTRTLCRAITYIVLIAHYLFNPSATAIAKGAYEYLI